MGRVLAGIVSLNPKAGDLPGHGVAQLIANGLGWYGLIAALVGIVIGAATWGLGSHTNNYQYSASGRRAVLVSAMAALVIGASPHLIDFLFTSGTHVG